jgi:hypothetical protein
VPVAAAVAVPAGCELEVVVGPRPENGVVLGAVKVVVGWDAVVVAADLSKLKPLGAGADEVAG